MINNKKGMSGIVVTLITVLLSIVAIGIVWMVVSGIISQSSSGAEYSAKCVNAGVTITSVTLADGGTTANVAIKRLPGGQGVEFDGMKITGDTGTYNYDGNIASSDIVATGITYADIGKVEAQVFFRDADDPSVLHYCDQVATFNVA